MKTTYGAFIKFTREARGLTQGVLAEYTSMSRASFVAVEQGTKELTLAEANALTKCLNITIDELLRAEAPNLVKYEAMIRSFLRSAKANKHTLKKTKLAKLLYLADFSWYYLHQKSLSGITYHKTTLGGVSDCYFRLLDEMEARGQIAIRQILRDDYHMYEIEETKRASLTPLSVLTKSEQAHLTRIAKQWEEASTAEIVSFTQAQIPYQRAELGAVLQYADILDEPSHSIY